MNNIEREYLKLMYDVFKNGELKQGRNGKTRSVFGRQIRHDMKLGFPLLTTKKMYWKGIVTELLWFLRGDTNIKFLVDNGCHIWDGDAYKNWFENGRTEFEKFADPMFMSEDSLGKEKFHKISKEWFIEKIKTDDEFAKKWGELGPVYGKQWRKWDGIDQITNLINDLKTNPDSRRLMVNAWNVGELDQMVLPPCHYGFQVYTKELSSGERRDWVIKNRSQQMPKFFDRLGWEGNVDEVLEEFNTPTRAISLMWNQRSADVFLGLPFNIASYGLLLEIIAKEVNMIPDELVGNIGDAHLYLNHIEQAKEQMHRELYPLPKIMFKDHLKDFDSIIDILRINDFILDGYQSHPTIKAPVSN
jgi:thymidylate synthase